MSVPTTLIIDTNIFDKSCYNFSSASMSAFAQAIDGKGLTLLMPDPLWREICRHIDAKAKSAVDSMKDAARRTPFLTKLDSWPLRGTGTYLLTEKIKTIVRKDLDAFLRLFKTINLGYERVCLDEIMNWYDAQKPPFSEKKRKEFPDALAIAIANSHHSQTFEDIAMISEDGDWQAACGFHPHLLSYKSLTAYAEALEQEDARLQLIRQAVDVADDEIREAIAECFKDLAFFHEATWDAEVANPELLEYRSLEYYITGIGQDTCNLSFDGEAVFEVSVSYDDYDSAIWDGGEAIPWERIEGSVRDNASISGTIALELSGDFMRVEDIGAVSYDQSSITVQRTPNEPDYS